MYAHPLNLRKDALNGLGRGRGKLCVGVIVVVEVVMEVTIVLRGEGGATGSTPASHPGGGYISRNAAGAFLMAHGVAMGCSIFATVGPPHDNRGKRQGDASAGRRREEV